MNAEYTGKKIAELRKEKELTQKELAKKLHVTDKAVRRCCERYSKGRMAESVCGNLSCCGFALHAGKV